MEFTDFEMVNGKELALAINGGNWDKDYTEGQKKGWYLKIRWMVGKFGLTGP